MGVLDKFLDAIKLNDDYDEEEFLDDDLLDEADDDDFLDDEAEDRPKKNFFQKFSRKKEEADDFDDFDEERWKSLRLSTKYYTAKLHIGSFYLPAYLEKMLEEVEQ